MCKQTNKQGIFKHRKTNRQNKTSRRANQKTVNKKRDKKKKKIN